MSESSVVQALAVSFVKLNSVRLVASRGVPPARQPAHLSQSELGCSPLQKGKACQMHVTTLRARAQPVLAGKDCKTKTQLQFELLAQGAWHMVFE